MSAVVIANPPSFQEVTTPVTLTVRMSNGVPFGMTVPKSNSKSFIGKGIVATFASPIIATVPSVTRAEFRVWSNVPEAIFTDWLACEDQTERLAILAKFGTPTTASSPVALTESEFDSWVATGGTNRAHGHLVAQGVLAFEPKRAAATTAESIADQVDAVYALLGRTAPEPIIETEPSTEDAPSIETVAEPSTKK